MEYKSLAPKVKIPALGLGTWKMGGALIASRTHDEKYVEAIKYAVKLGITHIDTAEFYGGGHAEELIGEALSQLKTRGFKRKNLFITTKVSGHHLSQKSILAANERSLKRLKSDYIDLYLIHWPNPLASMKNTMRAFDQLVSNNRVRFIGVSNFSVRQLQNAQKYSKKKIVANQVHYSLLTRDPQRELLPFCQKEKIILTAYSPLEQGEVIHKFSDGLTKIGRKYQKTPVQVALRWLLDQNQVIIIPKASTKEHIDEIHGSLGWRLKEEDWAFMDEELKPQKIDSTINFC